jgi:hypothetical protein
MLPIIGNGLECRPCVEEYRIGILRSLGSLECRPCVEEYRIEILRSLGSDWNADLASRSTEVEYNDHWDRSGIPTLGRGVQRGMERSHWDLRNMGILETKS